MTWALSFLENIDTKQLVQKTKQTLFIDFSQVFYNILRENEAYSQQRQQFLLRVPL